MRIAVLLSARLWREAVEFLYDGASRSCGDAPTYIALSWPSVTCQSGPSRLLSLCISGSLCSRIKGLSHIAKRI